MRPDLVEISVLRAQARRLAGVTIHRVADLSKDDVDVKEAIPVTTPARTLIDLAGVLPPDRLEEVLDDALNRRIVSLGWLRWRIEALARRGRKGIAVIAALCEARSGRAPAESVLETRLLRILLAAGLPEPACQYQVWDGDRFIARLDFAYPELKLAIEADGSEHRFRLRWQHDLRRGNELTRLGWRVLHITWQDVMERPDYVVALVAAELKH